MAKAVQINLKEMKLGDLIRLTSMAIRELERRLEQETSIFDRYAVYKGCSIETTWVRNKVGRKYYYPYLKCRRASIYLGNKPALMRMINMYKSLKDIYRHKRKLIGIIDTMLGHLGDVEIIIEAAREMREAEKEARKDQALLERRKRRKK